MLKRAIIKGLIMASVFQPLLSDTKGHKDEGILDGRV
jgi:hypothetical protein